MSLQPNVTRRGHKNIEKVAPLPPEVALAYRVNDAVRVSGLSRSTLYELIGTGELRSIVVAGRRLIPCGALRDLLRIFDTDLQEFAPAVPSRRRGSAGTPLLNPSTPDVGSRVT
jgi:hypothetical protein